MDWLLFHSPDMLPHRRRTPNAHLSPPLEDSKIGVVWGGGGRFGGLSMTNLLVVRTLHQTYFTFFTAGIRTTITMEFISIYNHHGIPFRVVIIYIGSHMQSDLVCPVLQQKSPRAGLLGPNAARKSTGLRWMFDCRRLPWLEFA